jgi:hypothetical protein
MPDCNGDCNFKGFPKNWEVERIALGCSNPDCNCRTFYLVTKKGKILCPGYQGKVLVIDKDGHARICTLEKRYFIREKKEVKN